ncbi:hypothetical protein QTP81_17085 [Alteromonas sp. ASW11-36]|uniref:Lipoprotein n=1 Tax=Alteromonas arenosi TaxID=3055817 RepID=A0ABT7T1K3_9ALTE|nr:hypothetical protein [Alteromonas sp. ASW11-36]MDM7862325.1 hypothetical protein [Alteromonas sp. ASW11-36]
MMKKLTALFVMLLGFTLAGCAPGPLTPSPEQTRELTQQAIDYQPSGNSNRQILNIKAAGVQGQFVYLNTELDYRDHSNITIAIPPSVAQQLEQKFGASPQDYFIGKSVSVTGDSRKIKVRENNDGVPTGKYVYQTHIRITQPEQIVVLN